MGLSGIKGNKSGSKWNDFPLKVLCLAGLEGVVMGQSIVHSQ